MLILDATTKSLEIKLAGAPVTNQCPFVLSYIERLTVDQSITAFGSVDGVTNSGTAVTVCAAPAAGRTRQITDLSVQQADTAVVSLTVQYNNNGTIRPIVKFTTLDPGDNVIYAD